MGSDQQAINPALRDLPIRNPVRMLSDITDNHPLSRKSRRSAGSNVRPDRQSVDGRVVKIGETRSGPQFQTLTVRVEKQDRTQHARQQLLGRLHQRLEYLVQRVAAGNLLQHRAADPLHQFQVLAGS